MNPAAALPPGPVRILSDLHLGHDMCSLRHPGELLPLIDGAGTLVLNGDTMEERSPAFRNRSLDQFGELEALCRRTGTRMMLINGNHDPDRWPHDWLDLAGGGLFVTHGHVLLRLISPWSTKLRLCRGELERIHAGYSAAERKDLATRFTITRRCSLAMPPSETRQKKRDLAGMASLLMRELWPPARAVEVARTWARQAALADSFLDEFRPAARVMLFGHTHRSAVWRRGGRLLVNSGGFVSFARPLLAELHGDRFSVFRIANRKGERRRGPQIAAETLAG